MSTVLRLAPDIKQLSLILGAALLIGGCAGLPYTPELQDSSAFFSRTIIKEEGGIRVHAAVPDAAEAAEYFQLPLYDKDVQPVWLSVENNTDRPVRLMHWSIDPDYFSPLEVAWMFRNGYSKEGKAEIERTLYNAAIDRRVDPGETLSGFIFTHYKPGTKGFNVDVISGKPDSYSFTFFVPMPGFIADYMTVDFQNLYSDDEITSVTLEELRAAIEQLPCCSTDANGSGSGTPFNVALVGTGQAVRRALLRAEWQETEDGSAINALSAKQFYKGRKPDGNFIKARSDGTERKELRLWLTPFRMDEKRVWLAQAVNVIADSIGKTKEPFVAGNIDDTLLYIMQDFWYTQSLSKVGFTQFMEGVSDEDRATTFDQMLYYTRGSRGVLVLSEDPIGLDEVKNLGWGPIPGG